MDRLDESIKEEADGVHNSLGELAAFLHGDLWCLCKWILSVARGVLSGWGSNPSPGLNIYQRIVSNNFYTHGEMVLGSLSKESVVPLTVSSTIVERVPVHKILGIMVNSDLKWDDHVAVITSKAGKRLWFLKQLSKAGISQDDLMFYYQSVVRPVLEYANLLALESNQRTDETTWGCSTACTSGHFW